MALNKETIPQFNLITDKILSCSRCEAFKTSASYVVGEVGFKHPNLIFVFPHPLPADNVSGKPMSGAQGLVLNECVLKGMGLHRGDYTILSSVKCKIPNRYCEPTITQLSACYGYLYHQIRLLLPGIIVTLGRPPIWAVLYGASGKNRPLAPVLKNYYVDESAGALLYPTYMPLFASGNTTFRKNIVIQHLKELKSGEYKSVRQRRGFKFGIRRDQDIDVSRSFLS